MRYTINQKVAEELANNIALVAEQDSKVVITFGKADAGEMIANAMRVTTETEQILFQFMSAKPEGFTEGVEIATDAVKLAAAIQSLLAFDGDLYIDIDENVASCGVEGKASVPVLLVTEAPQAFANEPAFVQGKVKAKDFSSFIRRGCSLATDKKDANGLENAVWFVNTETGNLLALSSDGTSVAKTEGVMEFANLEGASDKQKELAAKLKALLDEHLKKAGETADSLCVRVAGKSCNHMRQILDKSETAIIGISDRQVSVRIGQQIVYTAVQAVNCRLNKMMAQVLDREDGLAVGIDNGELTSAVDFIMKAGQLDQDSNKFKPITFSITDKVGLSAGKTGSLKANIPFVKTEGEVLNDVAFAGTALQKIAHSLDKSNAVIRFVKGRPTDAGYTFVIFRSGTIDEMSADKTLIGRPIVVIEEPKAAETDEATEG
jgi:hypothetical protein